MARIVARQLHWQVTVDAVGGSGYTTGGRHARDRYGLRLGREHGTYDVVLVEGGTNDLSAADEPAAMRVRVGEALDLITSRFPHARVLLMGAYNPPGARDNRRMAADAVIRAVAAERGVAFVSPIADAWTAGQPVRRFLSPDRLHPTAAGYSVMAQRLIRWLATSR